MNETNRYAQQFRVVDGCLMESKISKQGSTERKLCNFAPYLTEEVIVDDGVETSTRIKLRGVHQSGRELPEIEIGGSELSSFNWLAERWGMDCILEVGQNIKDSVRYAIQTTAEHAERKTVYAVTGWKKLDGKWVFLLPGDRERTVSLPGKMQGYRMEEGCTEDDLSILAALLQRGPVPSSVLLPLLALVFLSPLNHFLKLAGCEPKFLLLLLGKTGARKSTLAALMLSFFGRFTATELPLSFQDTGNSILYHAFALKDVLTCIDDFHPASRTEEQKLTATAQTVLRAYGDRVGRGRLRADSTPMASRPPQGNAIVTAEFPPDIGESGTARYFPLELSAGDVDLDCLSYFQMQAAGGVLARCMCAYLNWIRDTYLSTEQKLETFLFVLQSNFKYFRDRFRDSGIVCHGRVAETVSWLQMGMNLLSVFLVEQNVTTQTEAQELVSRFEKLLYDLAAKQAASIAEDCPSHRFVRKLLALLEAGQVCLLQKDCTAEFLPQNCIGYEDDRCIYLFSEVAHKAVREWCERQGESFTISCRALLKALAEEGFLETGAGQNTKSVRLGGNPKRVACLLKSKTDELTERTP